jgi:hypothetical protein
VQLQTRVKFIGGVVALAFAACATSAGATTVAIPDPGTPFLNLGQGDVSVTYGGVTFTQQAVLGNATLSAISAGFAPNPAHPAILSSESAPGPGVENILITLPTRTKTFSLDYGTIQGQDVSFVLSNGASFTLGSTGSSSGYEAAELFSTTQSTAFKTVQVTSPDLILNVNNITFSAVPEPATWAMMIIGTGMLGIAARRRYALAAARPGLSSRARD